MTVRVSKIVLSKDGPVEEAKGAEDRDAAAVRLLLTRLRIRRFLENRPLGGVHGNAAGR